MEGKENINTGAVQESTPWDQMAEDLNKLNEIKAMFGEEQVPLDAIEKAKIKAEEKQKFEIEQQQKYEDEQAQKYLEERRKRREAKRAEDYQVRHILLEERRATAADVKNIMAEEAQKPQPESQEPQDSPEQPAKTSEQPAEPSKTPETQPLIAINADWTHDRKEMAHDLAEQTLNAETAKGNIITKIWKGTLFKKYYEQKYTNEFFRDHRTNPEGKTVSELIREQNKPAMERFLLSAVEQEERYVHKEAGESLTRADEKTETAIKEAIEKYARRSIQPGEKITDLTRELYNEIDRTMAEAIEDGRMHGGDNRTNYLSVARQAAERYKEIAANAKSKEEHDLAMAQVMAGFRVYNADVRDGVRTQAHRDSIDKIVNKLESSKIGRFIPSEIVAGAAGAALSLTQTGARAIAGAAGGLIASSAIAGLRERNRVTEDRSRMMRDAANGLEHGNSDNKRTNKHELRIGGTLYDMQSASDLTAKIKDAFEMGKKGEKGYAKILMDAIAEARVRIDFSDSEQKDLISYSSDKNRGRERLELDKILIEAERHLGEKGKKTYEIIKNRIREDLIEGYEDESGQYHEGVLDKDDKFKNYRTIAAVKTAGKTLALGGTFFFVSQEVMAAIDPAKIGVFEKAGLLKTANNEDAKETILASGFGRLRGSYDHLVSEAYTTEPITTSDPTEVARLEADGYSKVELNNAWTETKPTLVDADPSTSTARVDVKYDGWASSGTRASGNELRTAISNGRFVSSMTGKARFNGQTLNYDPASVKGYLTIGDSKFEIAGTLSESGQMTWGDGGVFTTTTGETIKALSDNGEKLYKYFEVAIDNGVDTNGVQHIIPLATDAGANSFSGSISQVVEEFIEHPATYELTKFVPEVHETIIRDVSTSGIAFAPNLVFGARTGLGEARQNNESQNTAPATENAPEAPQTASESESTPESTSELDPEIAAALSELASINQELAEYDLNTPEPIRAYDEAIRERADLLGEDLTEAFLSDTPYSSDIDYENWRTAIENLSPEGLEALRDLSSTYHGLSADYSRYLKTGNAFRVFLTLNYPNLS